MKIGEIEETYIVEPIDDPFEIPAPAEPEKAPAEPEPVREPEKVPA